jgi:hypothetical protein
MKRFVPVLLVIAMLGFGGCANRGASGGTAGTPPPAAEQAPKSVPPPAGSTLAKVQLEMPPAQVREIMGAPTSENTYQTGKAWIPYYYGSDTMRTEWAYKGVGRVVFGTNRYSGKQKVTRIDYDPSEDGY